MNAIENTYLELTDRFNKTASLYAGYEQEVANIDASLSKMSPYDQSAGILQDRREKLLTRMASAGAKMDVLEKQRNIMSNKLLEVGIDIVEETSEKPKTLFSNMLDTFQENSEIGNVFKTWDSWFDYG